jgi:hypothetical protein
MSTPNVFAATSLKQHRVEDKDRTRANIEFDKEHGSAALLNTFVNRNPKNPEYFGYNKQRGYSTQYKKRNFFKR